MASSLVPFVVATLGALLMALAFPKTNAAVLAPVGTAALFWAWFGVSPKRAFWVGWLSGTIFFTITFWWFGETAGALIAPFGFLLALGPALANAFFGFALVGALVAFANGTAATTSGSRRALVPLAGAAVFAAGEWLRSEGLGELAVPFGGLGYTQVDTPLRPAAAFVGEYGVTFLVCILGAYAAYALRRRERGTLGAAVVALTAVAAFAGAAFAFWPARTVGRPAYRVAAIQGGIPQTLKFTPAGEREAVRRYADLTLRAAATHPSIVVWPETVIPTALNANANLQAFFGALAKRAHTELAVGTLTSGADGDYNVLYFYAPDGKLDNVYRKRQLVPFAEHLPFGALLARLPWAQNISHFRSGTSDGVLAVNGVRFGPIVCWESAFGDIAVDDVRAGAGALLIATDDAWFGTSAGPYQHAQIAQMRALETGRWIVRAASTGISGIIAPNGRYVAASALGPAAVVTGSIGAPQGTLYDALGGNSLGVGFGVLYAALVARLRLRRR